MLVWSVDTVYTLMSIVQRLIPQTPKQLALLCMQMSHCGSCCSLRMVLVQLKFDLLILESFFLYFCFCQASMSSSDLLTNPSTFPSPSSLLLISTSLCIICPSGCSCPSLVFIPPLHPLFFAAFHLLHIFFFFYTPSVMFPQLFPCSSLFQISSS